MKSIIEFPIEGSTDLVLIEIEEEDEGYQYVSGLPDKMKRASLTLEDSLSRIKPIAESVLKKVESMSEKPEEISVCFGLKVNAQAGVIVSCSTVEANFSVTLKWKRQAK